MAITLEQVESNLKKTADTIETAVADIKKNMATKKEVIDLIEERSKTDSEMIQKTRVDVDQLNTGVVEASAVIKKLNADIRNLKNHQGNDLFEGGRYHGQFSSPREAKAFALLVLVTSMANEPKLKNRCDDALKKLSDMGIEPYWVDTQGKAMTGSSQTAGGALVTVEQIPSIMMLLERYGIFRADAQNLPMGAGQTLVPKLDGLLTMYCVGEGGTITESDPKIQTVSLTPKTLTGITAYSMELEDDALVMLGELLANLFARSCAYYEDLCGFLGDGTSTYFGFKGIVGALRAVDATIASIKSLIVGTGNAYSELVIGDFEKVPGIMPDFADDGNAKWYNHRYFYWTVMVKLALGSTATATEVILGAGAREKQFLSYPVRFAQVMPKAEANSQICTVLGNLRQGAYLGTRGGIEVAQSSERYFDKGLIATRCRDRFAINVHGVGDTTNAGPICGLITAAS